MANNYPTDPKIQNINPDRRDDLNVDTNNPSYKGNDRTSTERYSDDRAPLGTTRPDISTPTAVNSPSNGGPTSDNEPVATNSNLEGRPIERNQGSRRARGTAAMDAETRQEVARKGGLAVSRNKQHMAEIGRKGGQSVSKNRDHMASIGRKGGEASRGRG